MVRLRTLGGLSIDAGTHTDAAARRRPLALLAMLARAGDKGISREKLAAFLWPESAEDRARNSLSQALSWLRREFGVEDLVTGSAELRLNPDLISSDVQDFLSCLEAGDHEGAVALYGGRFLDGVWIKSAPEFERWVEEERSQLHCLRSEALETLATAAAARGDAAAAIRRWRQRVEADPLDSRAALGLMKSLTASGDPAGALRHYRIHEALIRSELGVEPATEVVSLAEGLRLQNATSARARGEEAVSGSAGRPALANDESPATTATPQPSERKRRRLALVGALLVVAAAGTIGMAFAVRSDTSVITTVRLLTRAPDTLHLDASISPDGRFVAYAAGVPGRLRIFVREVGGQSAIQISSSANVPRANTTTDDHRWPRWSPDNATIAFSAGSRIYQVPMLGGPPRLVVDSAVFPAWSPDGKHLAYVYGRVLFVMPAMGGTARQIDTGTGPMLSWSPDGRRIAFAQQTGLYLGVTGIGYGAEGPASLWTIDADGRNRRRLIDDDYMNTCPVWGHDGRSIYFISNRDGGVRDIYRQRLGHDGAAHGPPERMTTGASVFSFTLSRDGSRIAYSTLERRREIWMAPIGVGETPWTAARPVTHEKQTIEGFMLSHDRRWIVYSAFRDGASHIFKVGFDGRSAVGQPIQLTRAPAHDASPRWSPDDRAIAFHRDGHAGTRNVFVVDADGRNEQRVTNGPGQKYDPDWSPDGREIVYRMAGGAGNGNNIYVVSRAAGAVWSAPRLVNPASGRGVGQSIRWSPSGQDLAFAGGDGRGVGLMLATGGPMRTIARMAQLDGPARFIAWGRDASHLYAMTFDSSTVASYWQVDVEGGPPRRILHLSDPTRQARETRFDADDRHVFFSIASDNADVFVASLRRR